MRFDTFERQLVVNFISKITDRFKGREIFDIDNLADITVVLTHLGRYLKDKNEEVFTFSEPYILTHGGYVFWINVKVVDQDDIEGVKQNILSSIESVRQYDSSIAPKLLFGDIMCQAKNPSNHEIFLSQTQFSKFFITAPMTNSFNQEQYRKHLMVLWDETFKLIEEEGKARGVEIYYAMDVGVIQVDKLCYVFASYSYIREMNTKEETDGRPYYRDSWRGPVFVAGIATNVPLWIRAHLQRLFEKFHREERYRG